MKRRTGIGLGVLVILGGAVVLAWVVAEVSSPPLTNVVIDAESKGYVPPSRDPRRIAP